jgi:hypothetical protein
MEWDSPLRPNDRGKCTALTPIDKGMKVRSSLLIDPPSSIRPVRKKNRHISASSTKAARGLVKYDPIGAMQRKQEVTEMRSRLSLEYKLHQLTSLGIPLFGKLGGTASPTRCTNYSARYCKSLRLTFALHLYTGL